MLSDVTVSVAHVDPHGLSKPTKHSHSSEKVSLALGRQCHVQNGAVSVDGLIDWDPRRAFDLQDPSGILDVLSHRHVDAVSLNSNDHLQIVLSDEIRDHVVAFALESFF